MYGIIRSRKEEKKRESEIREYMDSGLTFPEAIRKIRGE